MLAWFGAMSMSLVGGIATRQNPMWGGSEVMLRLYNTSGHPLLSMLSSVHCWIFFFFFFSLPTPSAHLGTQKNNTTKYLIAAPNSDSTLSSFLFFYPVHRFYNLHPFHGPTWKLFQQRRVLSP
jgi:hypothetical protein